MEQKVPLSNASWRHKLFSGLPISQQLHGIRTNTMHNNSNERLWEAKVPKGILNKILTEFIVSFFNVHFNSHPTNLANFTPHGVNDLLGHNDIVWDTSSLHLACMCIVDEAKHDPLEPVGNDFSDNFIGHIKQANKTKILNCSGSRNLGDPGD